MVKEEVGRRGTTDVFRSLKWLDLSGNELKDLKRLHESLAMLLGPRERTVVVRGNPPAERPDFPEWAKLLYDRVGPAKIRFITEVTEASISTATKAVRLIDPLPLRALRGQHGTRLVDKAKRLTEKKEKLVLQRTEGLLDPTLADEDVDTLLNARRRQIEEFVEDFESALSEMNGESSLTSVPFPLCESTQRNLNELLVKMDGETVEDSETEEVEDSCSASKEDCDDVDEHQGSILVKAEPPVLRVSSDESQSAPITQVDTAMAFITDKSSSDAPLRPKHREPTVSDVTGALGAMRMLREAESKYNETMLLCD